MRVSQPSPAGLSNMKQHETKIRVRYDDADPMGFLHHAKYLTYFEVGRTDMFRSSGGNYRELEESGSFVVVVKAEIRYRKPARYDDVLTLRTTLVETTMAKILHEYHLFREDDLLATGKVTLALIDSSGSAQRIPQWMRELV